MGEIEEANYKLDSIVKEMIKEFVIEKSNNPDYTKKAIDCIDSKSTKINDDEDALKIKCSMGLAIRASGGYHLEQKKIFISKEEIQKILSQKDKSKAIEKIMMLLGTIIHEYAHLLSAEVSTGEVSEFGTEEGYADLFAASVMDYVIKNDFKLLEELNISGLEIKDWKQSESTLKSKNETEGFITSGYVGEDEGVFGMTEILRQTSNKDVETMLEYLIGDKEKWREIVQKVFGEKFALSKSKDKILSSTAIERQFHIKYDSNSTVYNQRQKVTKSYERQQQIEQILLQDGGMNPENAHKIMEILGDEKDNSRDLYNSISHSIIKQYVNQCKTLEDLEKVKSSSLKMTIVNKAIEIEEKRLGCMLSGKRIFDLINMFDAPVQMSHGIRILSSLKKDEIKQYGAEELMKFTNPQNVHVVEGTTEHRLKDIFDYLSEQELSYSQSLDLERAKLLAETGGKKPIYSQAKCLVSCIKKLSEGKEKKDLQEEDKEIDLLESIEQKMIDYEKNINNDSNENLEELKQTLLSLSQHYQENSFWSIYYDRIRDIGEKLMKNGKDKLFNKESLEEVYQKEEIEPTFICDMLQNEENSKDEQER